jgi:hypothetical protein
MHGLRCLKLDSLRNVLELECDKVHSWHVKMTWNQTYTLLNIHGNHQKQSHPH